MNPEILRALLTVVFGAIAGGLTNTVAVWMLFHPYKPARLGPLRLRWLHGAVPKNQARLAEAVGRTVGNRLLTPDDLEAILANEEFRRTFDARLETLVLGLLETERGSIRDILGPDILPEVEAIVEGVAETIGDRLDHWLDTPGFEAVVAKRIEDLVGRVSDEPVGDVLTPAREEAVVAALEAWATDLVHRESFRAAVESYLERTFAAVLNDDRTFEDILPEGFVAAFERALSGYLPIAVRKLGSILEDPDARSRLESTVNELFQRFLRDLRFHQRLVARLVVTEGTLDRVLDTIEREGAEHLSEMLREPAIQDATARRINEAVLDFMQRPVREVVGHPDDEVVRMARETITDWIVRVSQDPDTVRFASEKLRQGLSRASAGTWGELLGGMPTARVSDAIVGAARSDAARGVYRGAVQSALRKLLERPIGRPSRWLPEGSASRIAEVLAAPLWAWAQAQIPTVVATLDVGRRVEEKVRGYPTKKLEDLVRRVTERELHMIVRLGYLLGAIVGGVLVAVNAMIGT